MKKDNSIGPKLSVIAKSKGLTQQQLADQCNISRLTIQRFFKGHTELKCGDLTQLLNILGFSLEDQINKSYASGGAINFLSEWNDLTIILQKLSPKIRKVLIEQILWWQRQEGGDRLSDSSSITHNSHSPIQHPMPEKISSYQQKVATT